MIIPTTMNVLSIYLLIATFFAASAVHQQRKVFIVYMGSLPEGEYFPSLHHSQIIEKIVDPSFANKSLVRSFQRSFNGFAAYLSEQEKQKVASIDGVVSVFPCQKVELQTTRSWDFMGISQTVPRSPVIESDIIIGVIDSGIWPESESFSDQGFGPIPSKWKGVCDGGDDFTCNRKIIGARMYSIDQLDFSARDTTGHGTHVSSIAAGNEVKYANYYGLAQGTARGGVPSARLAVYKACGHHCYPTDIMSAFDDAIADGVDIISVSNNIGDPLELTSDPYAVGAFHALMKDILTVNSAGNKGPKVSSITNYAPWILHVAASDIDRRIVDKLLLGKDTILEGKGINAFPSSEGLSPLVYGKEVTSSCSESDARNCVARCFDSSMVEQKVVLCDNIENVDAVIPTGALGYIIPNPRVNASMVMPYPIVVLTTKDLNSVKTYKNANMNPQVQILKSEVIHNPALPSVAAISSRGPSMFMPDIIKPDVTAPGVEILAAFSPLAPPSGFAFDKSSVKYNILTGTSMACPHVTAAAAYVKSFHPEWSSSAIKSALMTTAWEFNAALYSEAEFAYGSGHINPLKALNPGLVYETSIEEYLQIWCNISRTPGILTATNVRCPMKLTPKEINYPSMAAQLDMKSYEFMVSFPRTVTNVGQANSTYVASIQGDNSKMHISVEPNILQFTTLNQKMSFVVTVRGKRFKPLTLKRTSLLWTDGVHNVRSPIVLYTTSDGERAPTPSKFHKTFVVLMIVVLLY